MNSSIQTNQFEPHRSKNCIHTKNVYSLLDTPASEEVYKRMKKHLETCTSCNEEFQRFQVRTAAAQIYIPKALMDRDLRQSFEREVGELFKVMNLNNREILKRNVKKGFHVLDSMGLDFLKNMVSKTMIKAYLFALVCFICLKFFL